ncbi:DNA mismatch repair endonuclease MutL [Gottfriedia acidiceleris]|uniref:DNA mismatch repair protein MutL n=1 Tax=Gottfriedia acidiceleris TaxID=371036 RepID=A0ABY4JJE7_9BACI|nr:DNA mismatch repair endonuclease MutL [Gottfriedia acidiceleris]UPM52983.1 DNA mismatch repair endonuclease MutL [Gottfriedia acidiceleris]
MSKIQKLDEILANQIAAGEVVERPASVVKELLENAIDAISTRITVEINDGGLSRIFVSDNGEGMTKEDSILAFERHATSKIKDENDLFRIRTLGFRGEALPSIASVSYVTVKTSTEDGPGIETILKGGVLQSQKEIAKSKGTSIEVSNLFFNTPARLKYMRTVQTELSNVTDVVYRLALANPQIAFDLKHNDKLMFRSNGNGDARQILASLYGLQIAKNMVHFKGESLDFQIEGYLSMPEYTRATRNYLSLYVNGRYVKHYGVNKSISEGYHTLLPIGRFPIVSLFIKMDPQLVDVNVHPTKQEVRFSKEDQLFTLITESIKKVFRGRSLIPEIKSSVPKEKLFSEQSTFSFEHSSIKEDVEKKLPFSLQDRFTTNSNYFNETNETIKDEHSTEYDSFTQIDSSTPTDYESLYFEKQESKKDVGFSTFVNDDDQSNIEETVIVNEEVYDEQNIDQLPPLYPIGQMHGTYIIAQNEKGLYLIDQHAAQERIYYEYFKEKIGEVASELQTLLIPITFDVSPEQAILLDQYHDELQEVGLFIEKFGSNSYVIREHPNWFPEGQEDTLIDEMIQELLKRGTINIKKLREEKAIMMSCKASIKANQYITNDEIFNLLESLRKSSNPFTCPHGRPIVIHFSSYELEKMFKRVM